MGFRLDRGKATVSGAASVSASGLSSFVASGSASVSALASIVANALSGRSGSAGVNASAGVAATNAGINAATDWAARSGSDGVIYAENFDYANTAALIAAASQINGNVDENVTLETTHVLSGKGCRIGIPQGYGPNSGSWNNYLNGSNDTEYTRFYFQCIVYCDEHFLNYPYKLTGGNPTSPKLFILDQHDSSFNNGEVVITNQDTRGFVTAYRKRDNGSADNMSRDTNNDPGRPAPVCPNGSPDFYWQPAIDRGGAAATDCAEWKQRYGPMQFNFSGSITAGTLLDAQGTPDTDASIGGELWVKNGFKVVEVFVDRAADQIKVWAADYGEEPVLTHDGDLLPEGADISTGSLGQYNGFQLTPYRTSGISTETNRLDTYVSFPEVIVSSNPINFPGGFAPPSTAPKWFTDLTALTWNTPLSNDLFAVRDPLATSTNTGNTGHQSIIIAWTGMGVDQQRKTAFMLRNGGHADYYGNEIYAADLRSGSPAWVRVKNATSNSGGNPPSGSPRSAHTYFEHSGHDGRWFSTHTGSGSPTGSSDGNRAWEYDVDSDSWIDRGFIGNQANVGSGSSCYNPTDNTLILVGDGNPAVRVYDVSGSSFSLVEDLSSTLGWQEPMCAVDTTNNILLVKAKTGSTFHSLNLNNVQAGFTTFVPTGTRPAEPVQIVWHENSNAWLSWDGGNNLRKMTVTVDGNNRYSAGAWTTVSLSGTAPNDQTSNGLYDKVNMIQDMGNGESCFIVVPRYNDPDFYVLRISGAI